MSAHITRKRARVESEDKLGQAESSLSPCPEAKTDEDTDGAQHVSSKTKDAEFWFEDGTVIVHARDVEFRVYAGIVGAQFPRLKDLFADSDNPSQLVSMPGCMRIQCPVVSLEDSPEDLRHIFRICMGGINLFEQQSPSFHATSAYIRLGLNYGNFHILNLAMTYLQDHFPKDVEQFNKLAQFVPDGFAAEHAIGVVNLARLTGELSILPAAFMSCLSLGSSMVHGFIKEDGTRETLTMDDLGRCIEATGYIREVSVTAILRVLAPHQLLRCKNRCDSLLMTTLTVLEKNVPSLLCVDAFTRYKCFIPEHCTLCKKCAKAVEKRFIEERRKVWNRLPEIFNVKVPDWDVVEPVEGPSTQT